MSKRKKMLECMKSWIGYSGSNSGRYWIIDIYNSYLPHPRGYKMDYEDSWCAATISAAAIKCGLTDIIPIECSCGQMVNIAKTKGIWVENDDYVPAPGDLILFDWQDKGKGDCTGWPDHIGMVEEVADGQITSIEGNIKINGERCVGRRTTPVNGQYIRGYICPKYPAEMQGTLDAATEEICGGWAYNGTDERVEVSLTVEKDGATVRVISRVAEESRPDLKEAGIGDGGHAYTVSNILDTLPAGNYRITASVTDSDGDTHILGEAEITKEEKQNATEELTRALGLLEDVKGILTKEINK